MAKAFSNNWKMSSGSFVICDVLLLSICDLRRAAKSYCENTTIILFLPGYEKGETTQRIADAIFKKVKDYKYGIQMASFYIQGDFIPHVRMLETGYEQTDIALKFGLPFVCIRKPKPFDTVLLNYNWQIWQTAAFSLYAG